MQPLHRSKEFLTPGLIKVLWATVIFCGFMLICRLLAQPGIDPTGVSNLLGMQFFGQELNRYLSLTWIPLDARRDILYLLLLPTGALLIAMTRLTLGVRVLGLRAILIAIGFQEIGILPSLLLMLVVVATVLAMRPTMRRIRLPLYGRLTLVLSLVAVIMVGAVLAGSWLNSELIWRTAFFPVIIMAMIAESIAKTIEKDHAILAAWRTIWTLLLSLVIAAIGQVGLWGDVLLQAPEIMLLQIVAIILVAEYFDLRIYEGTPTKLYNTYILKRKPAILNIVLVRNRWNNNIVGRLGNQVPKQRRVRSVQPIIDTLRAAGCYVKVVEGDMGINKVLKGVLAPIPTAHKPGGLVVNLANGIQGNTPYAHIPSLLEQAGVAYTGQSPQTAFFLSDRFTQLSRLQASGVVTPKHIQLIDKTDYEANVDAVAALNFPIKITLDSSQRVHLVKEKNQLAQTLNLLESGHSLCIEEYLSAPIVRAAIVGNLANEYSSEDQLLTLPLTLLSNKNDTELCPAPITTEQAAATQLAAVHIFKTMKCRDYACIDLQILPNGTVVFHSMHCADLLLQNSSLTRAAEEFGMDFEALILNITQIAWRRYVPHDTTLFDQQAANLLPQSYRDDYTPMINPSTTKSSETPT